jgi:heptosyltransferase-2
MIDCFGALALPRNATPPADWPLPVIEVSQAEVDAWRAKNGLAATDRPAVAFAPGAVGPGKAWPPERYAELARLLTAAGATIWVLGGPSEKSIADIVRENGGELVRDLTGNDLRNAILALKAADLAVTNDSGLMHISAAIGTPTVAIFGPTSPRLWAPLNPLTAVIEPEGRFANIKDRSTAGVAVEHVFEAVRGALDALPRRPAAATRGLA